MGHPAIATSHTPLSATRATTARTPLLTQLLFLRFAEPEQVSLTPPRRCLSPPAIFPRLRCPAPLSSRNPYLPPLPLIERPTPQILPGDSPTARLPLREQASPAAPPRAQGHRPVRLAPPRAAAAAAAVAAADGAPARPLRHEPAADGDRGRPPGAAEPAPRQLAPAAQPVAARQLGGSHAAAAF